ncbi:MAG: GTPase HflX [Gammaproteobacteria bacterium]|nr:GTPase HflX [Gammaproteobacteria bacterium]
MFDRPGHGERAVLVHVKIGSVPSPEEQQEFHALALSAGAEVAGVLIAGLRKVNPRFLIGSGKLEELRQLLHETCAEIVLVDHWLSPAQQRNLEKELDRRVVDRTGLILDIFAQRARTHEGKLQVELAQLEHLATRLVRGWTHLERQKGGIGLRGPGETQLESDRRLIAQRIRYLTGRLARVAQQRRTAGKMRRKVDIPTVSLVGYTNAGKSTLFNRLTSADVLVADQLFATLDPTLRRVRLPDGTAIILADTVGFIRDLPHELVAAFRSTLEETRDSHLILHVIDSADPAHQERIQDVIKVLDEIGAGQTPRIQVYNKTDILGAVPRIDRDATGLPVRVWLSSQTGDGVSSLLEVIAEHLHVAFVQCTVELDAAEARLRASFYAMGAVLGERPREAGGWELDLRMSRREYEDLDRREHLRVLPGSDEFRTEALQ